MGKSSQFLPFLLLLHSPPSAHTPLYSQIHTVPSSIPPPKPTFVSLLSTTITTSPLLSLSLIFLNNILKIYLSRSYRPSKMFLLLNMALKKLLGYSITLASFRKLTYLSQENTALLSLKLSPPGHTHRHTQDTTSSLKSHTCEMEEVHARISIFSYRYTSGI